MFSGLFSKAKNALKEVLDDEPKFNGYMDKCFDKIDSDQSGFIEKEEVETLIKTIALQFKKDFEDLKKKLLLY